MIIPPSRKGGRPNEAGTRTRPLLHDPDALVRALRWSGLTQAQLARQLGRSEGTISEIVRGTRSPRPALLEQIARALGCPVGMLEAKRQSRRAA